MSRLQHRTLNQRVYQRLRELILSGTITPGEQLDEASLSIGLDVSRTPIREAIAHLVREGLVENRPYRGNFVRTFSARQVYDLYQVRKSLEALAIRLAIPNLVQKDLDQIRAIFDSAQAALDRNDIAAYSEADRCFHSLIVQHTGNETLLEVLSRLSSQIQMVRIVANQDPGIVERTARERPQILAALEARDEARAAQLMMDHIEGVCQSVMAQLEGHEQAELERVNGRAAE